MNNALYNDWKTQPEILAECRNMALAYLSKRDSLPPGRLVKDLEEVPLPDAGPGTMEVLQLFGHRYAHQLSNSAGPRYFGYVTGGPTPAALAGDWLVSAYDQNACGSNDSIAPQLERQTIGLFRQLFGLDDDYFGSFVTGATMSNFVGLALGRQWVGEQRGVDFSQDGLGASSPVTFLSGTPHSSAVKSLSMLGVGRRSLIQVDTKPGREAVDVAALKQKLAAVAGPCVVIANAGTVNTVDFDDLVAIGQLKREYGFWLHVDAAFGGFAACSEKYAHLLTGLNAADSITVDAHKWLNVPYDSAMQFTRHKDLQLRVFQNSASYLSDPGERPDFFHYTPENSRRFRALPSWFTLMAYGRDGYRDVVERNCDAAAYFGEQIDRSPDFERVAPIRMNVVCFAPSQATETTVATIGSLLDAIRDDGRVFFTPTIYKNRPAIRAAVSNWVTTREDADLAFSALTEVYHKWREPSPVG